MATDEILRLCEALSLSEEDGPVLDIAGDVQADGIRSVEHCLVGKILSRRKVNREAFRGTIEQIWGVEVVGESLAGKKQKLPETDLSAELQSEQVLNDIKLRERELESLLSKEELYWKQRSRVDWLLAGDKNSKFFHRRATARKKKNMISSLVDGRGIRRESEQGMSSVVLDYFSDLFKSIQPSSSDFSAASSFLERKVDTHMAGRLGEAFTRT
ncbi:hypothetical protein ACOSP7_017766 [Xanthoceras sorbifolium]